VATPERISLAQANFGGSPTMATNPTVAADTAASAIFSQLLDFLTNKAAPTAIQTFLTSAGINDDVAR